MINKRILMLLVLAIFVHFTAGCKKSNGGGFIASAVPGSNGKATIGFQIKCDNILHSDGSFVAQVTGNVQYHDHPAGVKVHGNFDFIPYDIPRPDGIPALTSCETIAAIVDAALHDANLPDGSDGTFAIGTYSNNAGQTGTMYFSAAQQNPEVCSTGKGIVIQLDGDISYTNRGCLDGGNLTIF